MATQCATQVTFGFDKLVVMKLAVDGVAASTGRRATYASVRASYPASKARADRINHPCSYYVWEAVSMRLAVPLINRGVSANAVTALALLALLAGLVFILLGARHPWGFLIGALLINLVLPLDNIDGHVARGGGTESRFGALADDIVSWLHYSLLPVCLGLALFLAPPEASVRGLGLPSWVWLAAGVARMFAYLLSIEIGRKADALLGGKGYDERFTRLGWLRAGKVVFEGETLLLLPAAAAGAVTILHAVYALYHWLILVVVLVGALRETARADRRDGDATP